jgi:vitamin B12/bleomycin/antimicrobial peptide transport system ATP-binding/permease protein
MVQSHGHAVARYLKTVRLFFSSELRSTAISWFGLLLGLLLTVNALNVVNSYVGRDFMTAISDRRPRQFLTFGVLYAAVFVGSSIVAAFYRFSEERLRLLWRSWLTGTLIDRYLANNAFFRLQTNEEIDNPDERITEDVKSYTQTTLAFFLLSLSAVITSLTFLGVLWSITPTLVLAAIVYASVGSAATILLGRPLVHLANLQLKKEANLRYHLIQTRETAETIATTGAGTAMRDCLHDRLRDVVANNTLIIAVTRNLGFFTNSYNYLTQLIPLMLVAPMYMRGEVEFGVVTQSAMAFAQVLGGFSLIISQFETISSFAAVTERLNTISDAIDQAEVPVAGAIEVVTDEARVAYEKLTLWKPKDQHPLIRDLTLAVPLGTNLLITGPNATAKTALFLATARVWEKGEGRIIRPAGDGICFVPKHPLAVRCGLRSQLVVPHAGKRSTDQELNDVLHRVGLERMVSRVGGLDPEHDWPTALSPEENRLLAIARVLLAAPRFVFLDRMDGDLTPDQIDHIYELFSELGINYLTLGEHASLHAHHDITLSLRGDGTWEIVPASKAAGMPDGDQSN